MLIIKCKARENTKIYLIDKTFKNYFTSNLKVKKLLAYCMIKNEANNQVFTEIVEKYKNYEQNNLELVFDSSTVVKEVTSSY